METNEWKDKTLEILDQIIESAKTFWILAVVYVNQRSNFWCRERNVFLSEDNFQLLEKKIHWSIWANRGQRRLRARSIFGAVCCTSNKVEKKVIGPQDSQDIPNLVTGAALLFHCGDFHTQHVLFNSDSEICRCISNVGLRQAEKCLIPCSGIGWSSC